jgi:large subunit ribosomal protein L40e
MSQTFFVRNLQNQTTQVTLDPGLTVREVKDRLGKDQGISSDQIRLVFAGKELKDDDKMTDYNVGPGSNVNMVLRLQGGSFLSN